MQCTHLKLGRERGRHCVNAYFPKALSSNDDGRESLFAGALLVEENGGLADRLLHRLRFPAELTFGLAVVQRRHRGRHPQPDHGERQVTFQESGGEVIEARGREQQRQGQFDERWPDPPGFGGQLVDFLSS